ncbi:MAG: alpha/beta hydrolase [Gulosibacter sp.]|uniref:alpha/beta hydrolase n=1 Tax=Gulosibacter sp. TaxID=2817531 RepID=UPI003F92189A
MTAAITPAPIPAAVGPRDSGPDGRPLLLLLHGFGSHERDLPGLVTRLGEGWDWLSVRAPYALETGGAAWFPLANGGPVDRSAIDAATAGLWEFVDEHTSGQPIVPIGFSQGGLMVSELFRSRPETVTSGALLSGFVDPAPRDTDAALKQAPPRVFFGRGTEDAVLSESIFGNTETWLREHADASIKVYEGLGHAVDQQEIEDLREFLAGLGLV